MNPDSSRSAAPHSRGRGVRFVIGRPDYDDPEWSKRFIDSLLKTTDRPPPTTYTREVPEYAFDTANEEELATYDAMIIDGSDEVKAFEWLGRAVWNRLYAERGTSPHPPNGEHDH